MSLAPTLPMQVVIAPTKFWLPSSTSAGPKRICLSEPVVPTLIRVARKIHVRRSHSPVVTGTRRFLSTSERTTDHDCIGAASERLANVAAFAHPAVSDDRNVTRRFFEISIARGRAIDRGGHLRNTESKHTA